MKNTLADEYEFLLNILCELKTYPEHNTNVIDQLISIINYRIEKL